jgi:aminopeptidase
MVLDSIIMAASTVASPPDYLSPEILLHPEKRQFPEFDVVRLLHTVFEPTQNCKVCILVDFDQPEALIKDFHFLTEPGFQVQKNAHKHFYTALQEYAMDKLGMSGGEMFAYRCTKGSNLDLSDEVWDTNGKLLSLDKDIYPNYKEYGFRGATLHGLNDVILNSGLAVDYREVSRDAEKMRLAMTKADSIEIDFALEDGRVLTATLELGQQEAQKSHGLCLGEKPDIANLPAGEVYFVPTNANGQFPMKYEDGTLGVLDVKDRNIYRSTLIEGNQATIDAHNKRLAEDPMTGTLGELGFGTQVLPVSYADIQDEKVLGTCHLATGRDDHLGGDILPNMFKKHENATHDDILFAPHNVSQVRMNRNGNQEILIENFRPAKYLMDALTQ